MKPLRSFLRVASIALALTAAGLASAKDQLTIGLIPSEDSQAMIEASKQVLDTLQTRLGMPVVPFVATDYNGIIEALRAGKLDVAYLGPFSYVLATSVAEVEAFGSPSPAKPGKAPTRA